MKDAMTQIGKIFDLCQFHHPETLVIAATFLFRYYEHDDKNGIQDDSEKDDTNLIALVCFYMAVKIHEPAALPLHTLGDLYRRFFFASSSNAASSDITVPELERWELTICHALAWRLNPPLAMTFVPELMTSARTASSAATSRLLHKAFRANPFGFCQEHRPSTLALAAVMAVVTDQPPEDEQEQEGLLAYDQMTAASFLHSDPEDWDMLLVNHHDDADVNDDDAVLSVDPEDLQRAMDFLRETQAAASASASGALAARSPTPLPTAPTKATTTATDEKTTTTSSSSRGSTRPRRSRKRCVSPSPPPSPTVVGNNSANPVVNHDIGEDMMMMDGDDDERLTKKLKSSSSSSSLVPPRRKRRRSIKASNNSKSSLCSPMAWAVSPRNVTAAAEDSTMT